MELELENVRELYRLNNLNKELLDANYNLLLRLFQNYRQYGILIDKPEIESLLLTVRRILHEIHNNQTQKLNTKKFSDQNPDSETELNIKTLII